MNGKYFNLFIMKDQNCRPGKKGKPIACMSFTCITTLKACMNINPSNSIAAFVTECKFCTLQVLQYCINIVINIGNVHTGNDANTCIIYWFEDLL